MIAFDFEYYKPLTINEAIDLSRQLKSKNKSFMYYGGGTEFISRARRNEIYVKAIIDLKGIPTCKEIQLSDEKIIIGSAVTLTELKEAELFPLLSSVIKHIATKTERNKITVGGNIASSLMYREALLPFLLAESDIIIAGENGVNTYKITDIFQDGFHLKEDEFIVNIITHRQIVSNPYVYFRKTKHSNINYPIVTLAGMKIGEIIHIVCSGVCHYPFLLKVKQEINKQELFLQLPTDIIDNMHASKAYRKFLFEKKLTETIQNLEGSPNE